MRSKKQIISRLESRAFRENETEYALGYREALQWVIAEIKNDGDYSVLADVRAELSKKGFCCRSFLAIEINDVMDVVSEHFS